MKKAAVIIAAAGFAISLAAGSALSAGAVGPGKKGFPAPEERLQRMGERLALTPEQKEKILPILKQEAEEMEKIRGEEAAAREAKRKQVRQIADGYFVRINDLLTPEQRRKHEEMRQRMEERAKERRDGKRHMGPPPEGEK